MPIAPEMSPAQLRTALDKFDVAQTDLARTVGASTSTAQRWVRDDGTVPVKLLLLRPELKEVVGLMRASPRGRKPAKVKRK